MGKSKKFNLVVRLWCGVILLSACVTSVCTAQIKDREITLAVEREFIHDEMVPFHLVDVQTNEGIVSLSGSVETLLAKGRARKVAETVKGVRAVINLIEVTPDVRQDGELRKDVEAALAADPVSDLYKIIFTVRDGVVTLSGTVDSWQARQICAQAVRGIRGVKKIENLIEVEYDTQRSDQEIAAEVKSRLEWDVWLDDEMLSITVDQGKVVLNGKVGSAAEKTRAYVNAWVLGTDSVDTSNVEVDWEARRKTRRRKKPAPKKDEEIQAAVERAFFYDPRVDSEQIDVEVHQGVVTLTGKVGSLEARRAAERDAMNTAGVYRVKNHLRARPGIGPVSMPAPSEDAEIARNIRFAFLRDPYVQQDEVSVSFNRGIAVLGGRVDRQFEKNRAEDIASGIRGVVQVQNNLQVSQSWTEKEDWKIKEDIESELWWSPFVDSKSISVSVNNGRAILAGAVDSLRERRAATKNAYEGGAGRVQNLLKVKNGPAGLRP